MPTALQPKSCGESKLILWGQDVSPPSLPIAATVQLFKGCVLAAKLLIGAWCHDLVRLCSA